MINHPSDVRPAVAERLLGPLAQLVRRPAGTHNDEVVELATRLLASLLRGKKSASREAVLKLFTKGEHAQRCASLLADTKAALVSAATFRTQYLMHQQLAVDSY